MLAIKNSISKRLRTRRKEAKLSQIELANRSGVSLGSVKRFEQLGEISLSSLIKLAVVLGYENDFDSLFKRKNYQSIEEVLNER
ncbi:MAG: helix-turn-helix domain-containing protein [Sphaerochaetaceae bacterium]|jgi:transcriptional regulator with XRE-family HTH domain